MLTTDGHGKICILPEEVIGRIAAGEVVERPAAVVKSFLKTVSMQGAASLRLT